MDTQNGTSLNPQLVIKPSPNSSVQPNASQQPQINTQAATSQPPNPNSNTGQNVNTEHNVNVELNGNNNGVSAIGEEGDELAGSYLPEGPLKIIYELILDLSYTLFITAIGVTITYDQIFRQQFIDYVEQPSNEGYIIALVTLGVITLALNKAYQDHLNATPQYKMALNFVEDIFRGIVYILMLVFISRFVFQNWGESLLLVSYILYVFSGALFCALKLMKWIYYLCGAGKGNYAPWNSKAISSMNVLTPQQRAQVEAIFGNLSADLLKGSLSSRAL